MTKATKTIWSPRRAVMVFATPGWSPKLDLQVLDSMGMYARMAEIARRSGKTSRQVELRWHLLKSVFRAREKIEAYGINTPYPSPQKGVGT